MNILTWNMQGSKGEADKQNVLINFLNKRFYDVICLQEASEVLGSYTKEVDSNAELKVYQSTNRHSLYTAIYYHWGKSNPRCSMITYVKNDLYKNAFLVKNNQKFKNTRGMVCVETQDSTYICNVHLISGEKVESTYSQFEDFKKQINEKKPHIIIGDYNINALMNREIIAPKFNFYDVGSPTHYNLTVPDSCLDYMYSSNQLRCTINKIGEPGYYSDHSPVQYVIPDKAIK